jgi:Fe-S-cluster containining protein
MLKTVPLLSDFDSGNGVCKYLKDNLCSIYDARPLICNISEMYEAHFKENMTEIQFFRDNLQSCVQIAKMQGEKAIEQKLQDIQIEGV